MDTEISGNSEHANFVAETPVRDEVEVAESEVGQKFEDISDDQRDQDFSVLSEKDLKALFRSEMKYLERNKTGGRWNYDSNRFKLWERVNDEISARRVVKVREFVAKRKAQERKSKSDKTKDLIGLGSRTEANFSETQSRRRRRSEVSEPEVAASETTEPTQVEQVDDLPEENFIKNFSEQENDLISAAEDKEALERQSENLKADLAKDLTKIFYKQLQITALQKHADSSFDESIGKSFSYQIETAQHEIDELDVKRLQITNELLKVSAALRGKDVSFEVMNNIESFKDSLKERFQPLMDGKISQKRLEKLAQKASPEPISPADRFDEASKTPLVTLSSEDDLPPPIPEDKPKVIINLSKQKQPSNDVVPAVRPQKKWYDILKKPMLAVMTMMSLRADSNPKEQIKNLPPKPAAVAKEKPQTFSQTTAKEVKAPVAPAIDYRKYASEPEILRSNNKKTAEVPKVVKKVVEKAEKIVETVAPAAEVSTPQIAKRTEKIKRSEKGPSVEVLNQLIDGKSEELRQVQTEIDRLDKENQPIVDVVTLGEKEAEVVRGKQVEMKFAVKAKQKLEKELQLLKDERSQAEKKQPRSRIEKYKSGKDKGQIRAINLPKNFKHDDNFGERRHEELFGPDDTAPRPISKILRGE